MRKVNPKYALISRKKPESYEIKADREASQVYVTDQTYNYPWVKRESTFLRQCHFDLSGIMRLTDQEISVYESNKWHHFPIQRLKNLGIEHKHFILPLILGGMIAPLALVSALSGLFQFWISMALVITGLMLFYYGIQGAHQVSLTLRGSEFKFFIDDRNSDLLAILFSS